MGCPFGEEVSFSRKWKWTLRQPPRASKAGPEFDLDPAESGEPKGLSSISSPCVKARKGGRALAHELGLPAPPRVVTAGRHRAGPCSLQRVGPPALPGPLQHPRPLWGLSWARGWSSLPGGKASLPKLLPRPEPRSTPLLSPCIPQHDVGLTLALLSDVVETEKSRDQPRVIRHHRGRCKRPAGQERGIFPAGGREGLRPPLALPESSVSLASWVCSPL